MNFVHSCRAIGFAPEGHSMLQRRSVLKLGAATVAGTLFSMRGSSLAAAWHSQSPDVGAAVFDPRFAESVAFADALGAAGVRLASAGPDIARLWYGHLTLPSGRVVSPIVGLTDRATLFCLEELARSAQLTVIGRVDHLADARGHVTHDPAGSAAIVAAAGALPRGEGFGREMAALLGSRDVIARADATAIKRTGPFSPRRGVALVSWVIA